MTNESHNVKVALVCYGNIARSQVLHHYVAKYASAVGLAVDVFSCGTAPIDAYEQPELLLREVERELERRGERPHVVRDVLDDRARERLIAADVVLVADADRRADVLDACGSAIDASRVMLFYHFIGEGERDFVDTFDTERGRQDPLRFARCFDELERIARAVVDKLAPAPDQSS